MKTFDLTTPYETYKDCYLVTDKYVADMCPSISIWNDEDGPIADITRCLVYDGNDKDISYLDLNNCPWAAELVVRLDIGKFTGETKQSGFCTYPLYKFDMNKVKEYAMKG